MDEREIESKGARGGERGWKPVNTCTSRQRRTARHGQRCRPDLPEFHSMNTDRSFTACVHVCADVNVQIAKTCRIASIISGRAAEWRE